MARYSIKRRKEFVVVGARTTSHLPRRSTSPKRDKAPAPQRRLSSSNRELLRLRKVKPDANLAASFRVAEDGRKWQLHNQNKVALVRRRWRLGHRFGAESRYASQDGA